MFTGKCRVCDGNLFDEPLLVYENMPAISQFLPKKDEFHEDKLVDLIVGQCSCCGLIQLCNDPVYYFRDVIRSGAVSEEVRKFRTYQFTKFVQDYQLENKKILEIGCGRGEYLGIMAETEAIAIGIENRIESVEECRQKGLNVVHGFLDNPEMKIEHGPFDAFYICNFLEHIDEPSKLLRTIANNLTDNAIGLVEVPNTDLLLKDKSFYKFTLEHLLNFTEETLKTALRLNGFEVLSCVPIRQGSPLSAVVRKRARLDFSEFNVNLRNLTREIDRFIESCGKEQIAIWGAGHYTFGILAVQDIRAKVKYIVDSAPFKQNRYSPKSHIPIVPPETLKSDPVKSIIVSAAGYSDEVVSIIQREFDSDIKIAVIKKNGLQYVN